MAGLDASTEQLREHANQYFVAADKLMAEHSEIHESLGAQVGALGVLASTALIGGIAEMEAESATMFQGLTTHAQARMNAADAYDTKDATESANINASGM